VAKYPRAVYAAQRNAARKFYRAAAAAVACAMSSSASVEFRRLDGTMQDAST